MPSDRNEPLPAPRCPPYRERIPSADDVLIDALAAEVQRLRAGRGTWALRCFYFAVGGALVGVLFCAVVDIHESTGSGLPPVHCGECRCP